MKPVISLVVAAADNNAIGKDNAMPWHIPEDFRHFKAITMGKPCIMGRKTFESILAQLGKPLPGRVNIIVSRSNYQHGGALTCKDLEEAIEQAAKTDTDEICIIGGAQIYAQALQNNCADKIYLTRIHKDVEGDAFFPALGPEWVIAEEDPHDGFSFQLYEKLQGRTSGSALPL
ncbi:MAG: dihydrofolate reductase [Micavibrio sp.]